MFECHFDVILLSSMTAAKSPWQSPKGCFKASEQQQPSAPVVMHNMSDQAATAYRGCDGESNTYECSLKQAEMLQWCKCWFATWCDVLHVRGSSSGGEHSHCYYCRNDYCYN